MPQKVFDHIFRSVFVLALVMTTSVWAATTDIDIDTTVTVLASPTVTTPVASPVSDESALTRSVDQIVVTTTPIAAKTTGTVVFSTPVDSEVGSITPVAGQGVLQMKTVYKIGLGYYQKQDFAKAIRYLKESLAVEDPYTPKFYYAEANAMLGVIYQFHIIDKSLARHYYQAALDIDPSTKTAKKHLAELPEDDSK